jgi:predicted nucleic acid-binding protein
VITLDTSGLYALLNRSDSHHQRVRAALDAEAEPWIVPAGILAEVAWMTETNLSLEALDKLLLDLETGGYTLDCGEDDFRRIRELVWRYADLPLGFADSAVIACAERSGGRVLTTDRRDFDVVARGERTIAVVPE